MNGRTDTCKVPERPTPVRRLRLNACSRSMRKAALYSCCARPHGRRRRTERARLGRRPIDPDDRTSKLSPCITATFPPFSGPEIGCCDDEHGVEEYTTVSDARGVPERDVKTSSVSRSSLRRTGLKFNVQSQLEDMQLCLRQRRSSVSSSLPWRWCKCPCQWAQRRSRTLRIGCVILACERRAEALKKDTAV